MLELVSICNSNTTYTYMYTMLNIRDLGVYQDRRKVAQDALEAFVSLEFVCRNKNPQKACNGSAVE